LVANETDTAMRQRTGSGQRPGFWRRRVCLTPMAMLQEELRPLSTLGDWQGTHLAAMHLFATARKSSRRLHARAPHLKPIGNNS